MPYFLSYTHWKYNFYFPIQNFIFCKSQFSGTFSMISLLQFLNCTFPINIQRIVSFLFVLNFRTDIDMLRSLLLPREEFRLCILMYNVHTFALSYRIRSYLSLILILRSRMLSCIFLIYLAFLLFSSSSYLTRCVIQVLIFSIIIYFYFLISRI